jgi:RNA polymerase sigma-70 factor (sigma-E family)
MEASDPVEPVELALRRSTAANQEFDAFYRSRWFPTVRLAHAVLGSVAMAEEMAQEAFIRTHARWESLVRPDAFLRTALLNLCRSGLRRRRLERTDRANPPVVVAPPEIDETWLAIGRMPFRQRAVLALRYYADLPEREIAELLGCRVGTVKSAHHRALVSLREELS